jgi:hypothetical protein
VQELAGLWVYGFIANQQTLVIDTAFRKLSHDAVGVIGLEKYRMIEDKLVKIH